MPTYTVPTSRSTGYLVTATNWNDELVGNMLYFKDAPVFDTAAIIGAATTNGIRLDIESGSLAVREGDDSGYGPVLTGALTVSGALTTSGMTITGALTPTTNDGGALGASGTAWSDLFLASGGVINFAAGDTTITQSAGKVTIAGSGAGALDVKGAILPTANDGAALGASGTAWADLFLASGGVLNFAAGDTTITHATGKITIGGSGAGAVDVKGRIAPTADDGAALGVSGTAWADLFLASGGVINFAAGETTITHSAGKLTIAGSGAGAIDVKGAILPTANDGAALGASGTAWADLFLASGGVLNFAASEATITHSATNTLSFGTSGSERLRITSGGDVAVAATAKLLLDGVAATGDTYITESSANTINMFTAGTSRMVIGSSGNVSFGYATPPAITFAWLNAGLTRRFADTTTGAELYLSKTRGTEASPTAVASGDGMGTIWFQAYGGTNHRSLAYIQSLVTTYTSDTDMTSHIRFATTNAGTTATERLRITGAGDVCIASGAKLYIDSVFGGDTYLTETAANQIAIFTGGSERLRLDGSGNIGVNVTSFGTSAAGVLGLKNGTEPSSGPADTVQFYSVDRSAGNTIPAVYCEGSGVTNAGITSTTVTHKIAMKVNGTVYYLLATTNAT